jgi:SAM-dependent methyltransferase
MIIMNRPGWLGCCLQSQLDQLHLGNSNIILDVGAGGGHVLEYLINKTSNAYGLDTNCSFLKNPELRKHFIKADAQYLPFLDNIVDSIVSFEVIEHLPDPDNFIDEAKRVIKSNGVLMLSTPTRKGDEICHAKAAREDSAVKIPPSDHVSVMDREQWVSKLRCRGFKVKIMTCVYPVATGRSRFISQMLTLTAGRGIGYWKRYFSVTDSRLFCEKP